MKFNERLKFFREKKGYTQDEIATKLNISRQSVSKWENGISIPDTLVLGRIADFFNVSVDYLLGLTDQKKPYPNKK